ncbi:hypothetical protein [Actinomycetospora corticicola]|jgi:hypothetical protein|uniref:Uncharacterized protein n=1 Tax=Actinomycetospora corticicola TaxID=663602 RepID=A0A7Y9DSW6_9PSEU|nr:hypothetical protein [Actinomycetospora corticicola]NYD34849.1 hypothetical protein [Actinomycetospora corticicola]
MKLIDPSRTHRPTVLRRPMPPSLARIPLVDLCTCKHPRESHEHYTVAQDCAQCDCRAFVRWEPAGI